MRFYDTEHGDILTIDDLRMEWTENGKRTGSGDPCTLSEYITNCLTVNNGTLEILK